MTIKKFAAPVAAGSLFGAGLSLSGMTDTKKVQNFLDVFGNWDPQLMVVMASALITFAICFHFIMKRSKPIQDEQFHLPSSTVIDFRLISGAALFGVGWGLVGYCPGPALAALAYGYWQPVLLLFTMILGYYVARFITRSQ